MAKRSFLFALFVVALAALMAAPTIAMGAPGGGKGGKGKGGAALEFFVDASGGDDSNDGSEGSPFASLERAQTAVRDAVAGQESDIVVNLRGGIHARVATFELEAADSGANGFDVVYRSAPGEQAILEGGIELSGWQAVGGGRYEVAIPTQIDTFRQFYADSVRQPRARSTEAVGTATQFLQEQVGANMKDAALVVPNSVIAGISHPEDLELLYVGVLINGHGIEGPNGSELRRPSWRSHRLAVEQASAVDAGHTRLDIQQDALYHASARGYFATYITPQDPFFLENAIELLDEPGEWFFDSRTRTLTWLPPAGVSPNDVETWIPGVETLLDINGTPNSPVANVRVEDLVFRHSTYLVTNEEGYVSGQGPAWFTGWEHDDWMQDQGTSHSYLARVIPQGLPGAAVEIDSAHHIAFSGNVFTELGAIGVLLHNDVTDAAFTSNVFEDISGSGLVAGHEVHNYIDEPMERLVERIEFSNNLVHGIGREYFTAVGVRAFKAADFEISNNHFVDTPFSAISLGWGHNNYPDSVVHRRNMIVDNHFENVMHTLYDGSAMYLLGPSAEVGADPGEGTTISGNFVDYSGAAIPPKLPGDTVDPDYTKRPGMQLDDGTRNVVINKNYVIDGSVWFQLTAWTFRSDEPGFVENLGVAGSNNWSNDAASTPMNVEAINLSPVKIFDSGGRPPRQLSKIIDGAGIDSPESLPTVP